MDVFAVENYVMLALQLLLIGIKIFALVSCLSFSSESYVAAGKLTKATWGAILGIGVVLEIVPLPLLLIGLAFTIAALVYLADVRPALSGLRRR
nr:DUF2516 family protein [Nocardioides luti]